MDKISELKFRKNSLRNEGSEIRKKISAIIDSDSFVELESLSISRNDFYGESVYGEGVVTGFATIGEMPVYVAAVNESVLNGGLGYNNCKKIVNCMEKAKLADAPMLYLLSSQGVLAGEGVKALEGIAMLLAKAQELKGVVPQFAVCTGKVLGSATVLCAMCDYTIYLKGSVVAFNSPLVIAAKSGVSFDETKIAGANSGNGLCSFCAENLEEVRSTVIDVLNILPKYSSAYTDSEDDGNRSSVGLNVKVCAKCLTQAVFDDGKFIELNSNYAPEVVTCIGRIGGYSAAAIIFNGENGVELTETNVGKIADFMYYASDNALPLVTFVNVTGLKQDGKTNASRVLQGIATVINALDYANDIPRINVITGKAIGLGYTLFASKAYGADYSFAFANAEVGPVSSVVGAEMEYAQAGGDKNELTKQFAENELDAVKAAESGCIDDVIEPQYVRQYIIAAMQMLV